MAHHQPIQNNNNDDNVVAESIDSHCVRKLFLFGALTADVLGGKQADLPVEAQPLHDEVLIISILTTAHLTLSLCTLVWLKSR